MTIGIVLQIIVFLYCENDKWSISCTCIELYLVPSCSPIVDLSHGTYKSEISLLSEKICECKVSIQ